MPAAKDMISLDYIKYQVFQNGEWQYVDWVFGSPTPADPVIWPNNTFDYQRNIQIPNASEGRKWKVKGSYVSVGGTWVIKFRVGKNADPGNSILYIPTLNNGSFEMEVSEDHLGVDDFTWVWIDTYSHTPENPQGIWVANVMRVTTG